MLSNLGLALQAHRRAGWLFVVSPLNIARTTVARYRAIE